VHRRLHQTISVVVALTLFALGSSGFGSINPPSKAMTRAIGAVPSKLVGRWSRNITQADWKRYGQGFPSGVWSFVVDRNGSVGVYYPHTTYVDFRTEFAVSGARLTINAIPICPTKGRYLWKVAGRLLTIEKVADPQCSARAALFTGAWKKR
jgi:hypothetical protein